MTKEQRFLEERMDAHFERGEAEDISDGGPAFAYANGNPEQGGDVWPGMSLRDWFAGQAAMGMATSAGWQGAPWNTIAEHAYELADALLLVRETQKEFDLSGGDPSGPKGPSAPPGHIPYG